VGQGGKKMSKYLLVHGAWAGGWSWEKVVPLLEEKGHTVKIIDLPGHGVDSTPPSNVTLQDYADKVCQALDVFDDQVILVGHSMGGIVISQAAELRPQKIKKLVYLSAYLLQNGEALMQATQEDQDSKLGQYVVLSEDGSCITLEDESLKAVIYPDSTDEDVKRVKQLNVPQPTIPIATPINITDENYGSIPRVYIECTNDLVISPSAQKKMYTQMPCEKVLSLATDHTPNYSSPNELVEQLLKC
jgi:pimeloyl-ACP methyl ester carboxylesterase